MRYMRELFLAALLVLSMTGQVLADQVTDSLDIIDLPEWEVTASSYGGKLLLSDSPEMVGAEGIMYQDSVIGDARLFFHHVNATTSDKRIVVLLYNDGPKTAHVTVDRFGLGGPGLDWIAVGKTAQTSYLAGSDIYSLDVESKGVVSLSQQLSDAVVKPNMLVNGIFDFQTDQQVLVKVMMMPVNADMRSFAFQAKVLPTDEYRLRGTFEGRDRLLIPFKVYDPARDGAVAVTLADNSIDRYLEGIDATDGSKVLNYGNYGVVYKLFLPSVNSGDMACYLNPRGGGYAGAIGVKYRHVIQPPVLTPADRLYFGAGKITDLAPLGIFHSGDSLWMTFSPPGASNLPVRLVIVPQ